MNHHKVRTILNIYRTYSFSLIFECLFCFFFVFQQSSQFGSFYSVWPIFRGSNQIGFELPIITFFFRSICFDCSIQVYLPGVKKWSFFTSFLLSLFLSHFKHFAVVFTLLTYWVLHCYISCLSMDCPHAKQKAIQIEIPKPSASDISNKVMWKKWHCFSFADDSFSLTTILSMCSMIIVVRLEETRKDFHGQSICTWDASFAIRIIGFDRSPIQ